jgi:hypothetical protein
MAQRSHHTNSFQDFEPLLIRKSLQFELLHWSHAARKCAVVNAISEVEKVIVGGDLQVMKCSDDQDDTTQIILPRSFGGLRFISCLIKIVPHVMQCCQLLL